YNAKYSSKLPSKLGPISEFIKAEMSDEVDVRLEKQVIRLVHRSFLDDKREETRRTEYPVDRELRSLQFNLIDDRVLPIIKSNEEEGILGVSILGQYKRKYNERLNLRDADGNRIDLAVLLDIHPDIV